MCRQLPLRAGTRQPAQGVRVERFGKRFDLLVSLGKDEVNKRVKADKLPVTIEDSATASHATAIDTTVATSGSPHLGRPQFRLSDHPKSKIQARPIVVS